MKRNITFALVIFTLLSCGTKSVKTDHTLINTTDTYIVKIESNKNLIEESTEGALTDKDGFKDIGTFKYTVLFDKVNKELFRIKNIETTDKTVIERYYYHNHNLVYIEISTLGQPDKRIYTQGNKRVVSKTNLTDDEVKLFLNKAKRFKTSHYRSE